MNTTPPAARRAAQQRAWRLVWDRLLAPPPAPPDAQKKTGDAPPASPVREGVR